jgi:hypothetical protein
MYAIFSLKLAFGSRGFGSDKYKRNETRIALREARISEVSTHVFYWMQMNPEHSIPSRKDIFFTLNAASGSFCSTN